MDAAILAPNDGTARAIADAFGADKDVTSYVVTGQDAEKAFCAVHHRWQAVDDGVEGCAHLGGGCYQCCGDLPEWADS